MIFCFKCGHLYKDLNDHICGEETTEELGKRLAKELDDLLLNFKE